MIINDLAEAITNRLKTISSIKVVAYYKNRNCNSTCIDIDNISRIYFHDSHIMIYVYIYGSKDAYIKSFRVFYDDFTDIDDFVGDMFCRVFYDC